MTNSENSRSIRFPQELWDVIDKDSKRCRRSVSQQIEMILSVYYGLEEKEPEINPKMFGQMRQNPEEVNNNQINESLMKTIKFGRKSEKDEVLIDEEAIIYQGKALHRQKHVTDDENDKNRKG